MNDVLAGAEIRVICGATAAGKSRVAMQLALQYGASVISADSRQVYRGFDIGTAKPDAQEQAQVPHYCIDSVDPTQRYSAAAWASDARAAIAAAMRAGSVPIVVGGTGFYLRALFEPLFAAPPMDAERRNTLQAFLEALPLHELRRWCEQLDPRRANLGRAQLLRALEIALLTGQQISVLHTTETTPITLFPKYLLVDRGAVLPTAIASRIGDMFARGWEAEVGKLSESVPVEAPAWNATGYMAVLDLVRGASGRTQTMERVLIETRRYAKRQRTWFRNQLPADRTTVATGSDSDIAAAADKWWNGDGIN